MVTKITALMMLLISTLTLTTNGVYARSIYDATQKEFNDRGINVKWYGVKGDNTFDNAAIFANIIAAVGANETDLYFPKGNYKVSSNVTFPKNITLTFANGAVLNLDNGVTLAISGEMKAGLNQIFSGQGTVNWLAKNIEVYPQWWGAKGDGVADDTNAIQTAFDSLNDGDSLMFEPSTTYKVSNTINLYGKSNIKVYGNKATINQTDSSKDILLLGDGNGVGSQSYIIQDLNFTGGNCGITCIAGGGTYMQNCKILRCNFNIMSKGIYLGGDWNTIENCKFVNCANYGINNDGSSYANITNNYFNMCNNPIMLQLPYYNLIANNLILNFRGHGILVGGSAGESLGCQIMNNRILGAYGHISAVSYCGIRLTSGTKDVDVKNNICAYATQHGINSLGENINIDSNTCYTNGYSGIQVDNSSRNQIRNNTCYNNNQSNVGAVGIAVVNTGDGNNILNNSCYDTQTTKTQLYGIVISATQINVLIQGNYLLGNKNGPSAGTSGSNCIYRLNNDGLTQEVFTKDILINDKTKGLILISPNGTKYRISVSDGGEISTSIVP